MSYRIALADVEALSKGAREAGTEWARGAQDVNARVGALCATSSFAGSAADAVRARLTEADSVVALALGQLAQEIAMRATVDAAYLPDGEMTALAGAAHAGFTNFDGLALEVGSAVSSVSDLVGTSAPSSQTVLSDYEALWAEAERTRDDAGALEARQAGELATATALADALDDFLSRCEGTAPGSFTAGSLSATPELASLAAAYQASGAATLGLEAAYESASAREQSLAEDRAAEERERSGWWQLAGGVFAAAVGVGAIVLSGGAAIPVVLGVGAAVYGAAEMDEARQNISLGSAGDATTSTWNFLRDGAMGGNQTAYDVFGFVTTSGAGAFALGGTALRGAIQGVSGAQRLKFTADVAIKALTADAMGTAAGAGASEVSRRLGLSDGQARCASWTAASSRTSPAACPTAFRPGRSRPGRRAPRRCWMRGPRGTPAGTGSPPAARPRSPCPAAWPRGPFPTGARSSRTARTGWSRANRSRRMCGIARARTGTCTTPTR